MRVLVVDDDETIRLLLDVLLRDEVGIEIVGAATNGEEAVELCAELAPDLVIMDGEMPVMNGAVATRVIKDRYPDVHVLGFSSSDQRGEEMMRFGAYRVLMKGCQPDILVDAIRSRAAA